MAIYNGRILMRKGNEADFDSSKLMSGEWAVSLDAGIVRICLEAGKVIRMATYEAFEEDMKQIEAILLECQSIEEAVRRINTEVSEKLNACAEYVQQAKNYSEQAKTSEANAKSSMQSAKTSEANAKVSETNAKASENSAKEYENSAKLTEERAREVFESIPEDYSTISNDLYELAIKETASGEEIHVNDSSNLKLREFALYGKAKQNTTTGKNLLKSIATSKTENGIVFTVNEDKSVKISGTNGDKETLLQLSYAITLPKGKYILTDKNGTTNVKVQLYKSDWSFSVNAHVTNNFELENDTLLLARISVKANATVDTTLYPMIRKCDENGNPIGDDIYEPFTNGASPNPQYPQPIEVSGASGSVTVKSIGKNLFKNIRNNITHNGITYKINDKGLIVINGTATETAHLQMPFVAPITAVIKTSDKAIENYDIYPWNEERGTRPFVDESKNATVSGYLNSPTTEMSFYVEKGKTYSLFYRVKKGVTLTNKIVYPMVSVVGGEYQPYKETLATIPTENGLASVNDIRDVIVKYADGSGEYVQRVGSEKITSSDFTGINTSEYGNFSTCRRFKGKSYGKVVSNRFIGVSFDERTSKQNIYRCYMEENGYIVLRITKDNLYTTIEEFKNMIDESETVVYYELAEPIITPLTAEEIAEIEKLHTFYPVTNISNDFDCEMSVTYYADSKNYIENQLAIMKQEQEEAMMNILSLMPTEVQATMIENDTNELLKESEI